jgi:hypothetical protein
MLQVGATGILEEEEEEITSQGCEADHLPPTSTEVKKCGAMPALTYMSSWHVA